MSRTAVICTILILLAAALFVVWMGLVLTPAAAETASPSPTTSVTTSPTTSPSPTVTPAPASTVRWALGWRRAAVRRWKTYNRARACLGMQQKLFAAPRPPRSADKATWMRAGRRWRSMARSFPERTARLVWRMRHPGGSGAARWWPLARWVGWPSSQRGNVIKCVGGESGGNPRASNGVCRGLMQIHECHAADWLRHIGRSYWRSWSDAACNLAYGLVLWLGGGWGPWVTM